MRGNSLESVAPQVAAVVRGFLARGWGIGSGGARGADALAPRAVVVAGPAPYGQSKRQVALVSRFFMEGAQILNESRKSCHRRST